MQLLDKTWVNRHRRECAILDFPNLVMRLAISCKMVPVVVAHTQNGDAVFLMEELKCLNEDDKLHGQM